MHMRRISSVIGPALILVMGAGLLVNGEPILPKEQLSDQVRSLAHLKEVRIDITPLPAILTENHVRIPKLDEIVRAGLSREGMRIGDNADLPRVNVTVMAANDPDMPGAVGVTILIMVNQRATVHRLDAVFDEIPTATVVEHAMATPDNVANVVERHLDVALWVLNALIQKASVHQAKTQPPS